MNAAERFDLYLDIWTKAWVMPTGMPACAATARA